MKPKPTEAWAICRPSEQIIPLSVREDPANCWDAAFYYDTPIPIIERKKEHGYTCIPVTILPREVE